MAETTSVEYNIGFGCRGEYVETLVNFRVTKKRPSRLLSDKAADADWLRDVLASRGIEQVTQHAKDERNLRVRTDKL
jgi:hypothetical protein